MMKDVVVVIPARLESTRFPRKPLHKILGKEMILHVLDRVTSVVPLQATYVATDSIEIARLIESSGFQYVMTGQHQTGTDRLAEANRKLNADFVLNIQGDEPIFNPDDILTSINFLLTGGFEVVTGYCASEVESDFMDPNTIKLVFSENRRLMYISRAGIPGSKKSQISQFFRQVCMYGYTKQALENFSTWKRTPFEILEDHELLRFLERDISVGLVELTDWSVPVDLPTDVLLVEKQMIRLLGDTRTK